jgi:hypothetical protein
MQAAVKLHAYYRRNNKKLWTWQAFQWYAWS